MMTLEQLYNSKLTDCTSREQTFYQREWLGYVSIMTKKLYVKVLTGPSAGTVGMVESIEPKLFDNGEFDPINASISYHVSNQSNTNWLGSAAYKRVQAKDVAFQKSFKGDLVYVSNRKKPVPRFTYAHFNSLGQELLEGAFVVSVMDGGLVFGTISKITRTNIRIKFGGKEYTPNSVRNTVVIDDVESMKQDAMAAMLAGWDGSMWHLPDAKTVKTKIKKVTA